MLILELTVREFEPLAATRHLNLKPTVWMTDAKSLYDVLVKDAGRPADKRVRILVAALRQSLRDDGNNVQLVDSLVMMADTLTKDIDPETRERLLTALETNMWSIVQPTGAKVAKSKIAAGRQARRQAAKLVSSIKRR